MTANSKSLAFLFSCGELCVDFPRHFRGIQDGENTWCSWIKSCTGWYLVNSVIYIFIIYILLFNFCILVYLHMTVLRRYPMAFLYFIPAQIAWKWSKGDWWDLVSTRPSLTGRFPGAGRRAGCWAPKSMALNITNYCSPSQNMSPNENTNQTDDHKSPVFICWFLRLLYSWGAL